MIFDTFNNLLNDDLFRDKYNFKGRFILTPGETLITN